MDNKTIFTKEEMIKMANEIMAIANEMNETDTASFYYYGVDRDGWIEERCATIAIVKKR